MIKGLAFRTDGTIAAVELPDGGYFGDQVEAINAALGSEWYDVIDLDGIGLFFALDAARSGNLNPELTCVARAFGFAGCLMGTGLFVGLDSETGTVRSLSDEQLSKLVIAWGGFNKRQAYALLERAVFTG